MFRTILISVLLVLVMALSPYFAAQRGVVEVSLGDWQYKTTLFVAVIGFIIFLVVLYLAEFLLRLTFRLLFGYFVNRRANLERRASRQAERGLRELVAGNYQKAQRLLKKSSKNARDPVLNLTTTFEVALRNNDMLMAEATLKHAIEIAQEKDEPLINVCKLKYFVARKEWSKAYDLVVPLLDNTNTEEVNLLAVKIFLESRHFGKLEDLLPVLVERKYLSKEQAAEYFELCEKGFIDIQYKQGGLTQLMTWWENQTRKRRFNIVARNVLLEKLIELNETQHAIEIAAGTFKLCKIKEIEASKFIDLVTKLRVDTVDRKLCRTLETSYVKFSEENQYKLLTLLSHLYYQAGAYQSSLKWTESIMAIEDRNERTHNTDNMLLAQVLYRRLGEEQKLDSIAQKIDGQLHLTYSEDPVSSAKEKAEKAEKDQDSEYDDIFKNVKLDQDSNKDEPKQDKRSW